MLRSQPFDQIDEAALRRLVEEQVPEDKYLEYKRDLPTSDGAKKEFRKDVSAFANTDGGDLIIGIEEDGSTRIPVAADGVAVSTNADEMVGSLDSMIRDGINPRIFGCRVRAVPMSASRFVFVIRVPKSFHPPHMAAQDHRLYLRNSNGTHPMDVSEMRRVFLFSDSVEKQIKTFKEERITKILSGDTPVPLFDGPKIVIHFIPFTAFDGESRLSPREISTDNGFAEQIYGSYTHRRPNVDGMIAFSRQRSAVDVTRSWSDPNAENSAPCGSYVQVFRTGIIEAVNLKIVDSRGEQGQFFASVALEQKTILFVTKYIELFKKYAIPGPITIMFTFLFVKSFQMSSDLRTFNDEAGPVDRDHLFLPQVVFETLDEKVETTLRPVFDALWNACGWEMSANYDEEGNWRPHGR